MKIICQCHSVHKLMTTITTTMIIIRVKERLVRFQAKYKYILANFLYVFSPFFKKSLILLRVAMFMVSDILLKRDIIGLRGLYLEHIISCDFREWRILSLQSYIISATIFFNVFLLIHSNKCLSLEIECSGCFPWEYHATFV